MMATAPVKEHVFYVADMEELQTLLTSIGESSCKSKWWINEPTNHVSNLQTNKRKIERKNEGMSDQTKFCSWVGMKGKSIPSVT